MASRIAEYDEKSGLPFDRGYLECGLPCFLQESIEQMKKAWKKLDAGEEYLQWDCDFSEQAWYLREKYLRIEKHEFIE